MIKRYWTASLKLLPWIFIVIFSYQYIRLSFLNEIHLRNGIDLGTYNQILYNINQGEIPPFNSLKGQIAWGDHAHFIMLLLAPIYRLLPGPHIILVIQVLAITTSAWAIYKIAQDKLKNYLFSFAILISYLMFFGIQYALDFDFHANVLTAATLAWSLYAIHFRKWDLFWITFIIGLLTREDAALFYFMIGLYFAIFRWKEKKKLAVPVMAISLIYFLIVVYKLMPQWTPGGVPVAYFDAAGDDRSVFGILKWFLKNMFEIFKEIFGDGTKRSTAKNLVQAFGYLPLFSPLTYLAAAPNLFARFLSGEYQRHLMSFHYNASLVSILSYGAILGTSNLTKLVKKFLPVKNYIWIVPTLAALILAYGTYASSWRDTDLPLHKLSKPEFTDAKYQPLGASGALQIIKTMIPADKSVSASSGLVPQLSGRPYIYNFPEPLPKEPMWLVLSSEFNTWPLKKGEIQSYIEDFKNNPKWNLIYADQGIYVFKR